MIGVKYKNPDDRLRVLKLFLDNGQNVNAIGRYGMSILILFVGYNHIEAVKYLLDCTKIDFNIKLTEDWDLGGVGARAGDTALDIARKAKLDEIVAMLEEVTASLNCI